MAFLFILPTWPVEIWTAAMKKVAPDLDVRVWPDGMGKIEDIEYCAAWLPPPGVVKSLPNLKVIMSLGAGVDALLEDHTLPAGIPITRMVDAGMGRQMAEYATYAVMHFHRHMQRYAGLQREGRWAPLEPVSAARFTVGIMGLGVLGAQAAQMVASLGYPVLGWSRTPKQLSGVEVLSGDDALPGFLGRTRLLLNFLPLTPATRGVIDARLLAMLPRGAFVVNLARGGHLVEADLLAALDRGHVAGAMLDVFEQEPLPATHPFWRHPAVVVTPHVAAVTQAEDAAAQVIANLQRLERGEMPTGLVDRSAGY
jgi:glyoxylate/hydroxypyruvate reductase A